jgi:hypothetical protein
VKTQVPIVKSSSPERLEENLQVLDFELSDSVPPPPSPFLSLALAFLRSRSLSRSLAPLLTCSLALLLSRSLALSLSRSLALSLSRSLALSLSRSLALLLSHSCSLALSCSRSLALALLLSFSCSRSLALALWTSGFGSALFFAHPAHLAHQQSFITPPLHPLRTHAEAHGFGACVTCCVYAAMRHMLRLCSYAR